MVSMDGSDTWIDASHLRACVLATLSSLSNPCRIASARPRATNPFHSRTSDQASDQRGGEKNGNSQPPEPTGSVKLGYYKIGEFQTGNAQNLQVSATTATTRAPCPVGVGSWKNSDGHAAYRAFRAFGPAIQPGAAATVSRGAAGGSSSRNRAGRSAHIPPEVGQKLVEIDV